MKTNLFNVFMFIIVSTILYFNFKNYSLHNKKINYVFCCDTIVNNLDDKWVIYQKNADTYLSRDIFDGTPLNGKLLSYCAKKTYEEFGVFIPVELALSQAQIESGMGRYGRTPITNPYNLGEYSDRTVLRYKNKEDGVMGYYKLIAKNYLNYGKRTVEDLFNDNFKDKNGYRYAGSSRYGIKIKKQYIFIKEYINNNSQKNIKR